MSRATISQLEALIDFLEQNPGIANGQLRTVQGKEETKRKWASLAITLNALGGVNKDGAGWAKYWAEKKCALKKQCSEHAASMRHTGGGLNNLPSLSTFDSRLVKVISGCGFALCDSGLAVEPSPQTISQTDTPVSAKTEELDIDPSSVFITTMVARSTTPLPQAIPLIPIPIQPDPLQSTRRRSFRNPRRPRRFRPSLISVTMDRITNIEERRVAAETVTAQAFADATVKLDRCAAALEKLAEAVKEGATTIANALLEIAVQGNTRN